MTKVTVTKYFKKTGKTIKPSKTVTLDLKKVEDWNTVIKTAYQRLQEDEVNAITLHFVKEVK
jgi:hypothetical protein